MWSCNSLGFAGVASASRAGFAVGLQLGSLAFSREVTQQLTEQLALLWGAAAKPALCTLGLDFTHLEGGC